MQIADGRVGDSIDTAWGSLALLTVSAYIRSAAIAAKKVKPSQGHFAEVELFPENETIVIDHERGAWLFAKT